MTMTSADLVNAQAFLSTLNVDGKHLPIEIRSDGFVNAKRIGSVVPADKRFKDYRRLQRTGALMDKICASGGSGTLLPVDLVDVDLSGANGERATWIHPDLAIPYVTWVAPEFELAVSRHIKAFMKVEVTTEQSLAVRELIDQQQEEKLIDPRPDEEENLLQVLGRPKRVEVIPTQHDYDEHKRLLTKYGAERGGYVAITEHGWKTGRVDKTIERRMPAHSKTYKLFLLFHVAPSSNPLRLEEKILKNPRIASHLYRNNDTLRIRRKNEEVTKLEDGYFSERLTRSDFKEIMDQHAAEIESEYNQVELDAEKERTKQRELDLEVAEQEAAKAREVTRQLELQIQLAQMKAEGTQEIAEPEEEEPPVYETQESLDREKREHEAKQAEQLTRQLELQLKLAELQQRKDAAEVKKVAAEDTVETGETETAVTTNFITMTTTLPASPPAND